MNQLERKINVKTVDNVVELQGMNKALTIRQRNGNLLTNTVVCLNIILLILIGTLLTNIIEPNSAFGWVGITLITLAAAPRVAEFSKDEFLS